MAQATQQRHKSSQVRRPRRRREVEVQMFEMLGKSHALFPRFDGQGDREGLLTAILQKDLGAEEASRQGVLTGRKPHPFQFDRTAEFKTMNPHHSACIDAKKISMVGLGHAEQKVHDALDPLCQISWQHTVLQKAEDLENTGNAYLEVIREDPQQPNSRITGLHWMPSRDAWIYMEDARYNFHYEISDRGSLFSARGSASVNRKFAKFGDLTGPNGFFERHPDADPEQTSELIHFMEPSALSRFYGVPNWLAAVAYVELAQAMIQHQFDFHVNRGVPEFMLFILGQRLKKEDWRKVQNAMKAQIGAGNSHKSIALNIPNSEIKVQLEKLAMEASQDGEFFSKMIETLAMSIISAHRVPPTLAQILIPGKMGAANEASNAIVAFQGLVIGPKQVIFESTLGNTLGNPQLNGGIGLQKGGFELKTVVDEISETLEKLQQFNTMGRMRQEMGDAAVEGRDLNDGLKKAIAKGEWSPEVAEEFLKWLAWGAAQNG